MRQTHVFSEKAQLDVLPVERPVMPRVIVVDDALEQRAAVVSALRTERFEGVEASSGEDALALRRGSPSMAVVLDVDPPDVDGYAVCRRRGQLTDAPRRHGRAAACKAQGPGPIRAIVTRA